MTAIDWTKVRSLCDEYDRLMAELMNLGKRKSPNRRTNPGAKRYWRRWRKKHKKEKSHA